MRSEFQVHRLNEAGMGKATELAEAFSSFLDSVERMVGKDGRHIAIVRTKLEEACFFAKNLASDQANCV